MNEFVKYTSLTSKDTWGTYKDFASHFFSWLKFQDTDKAPSKKPNLTKQQMHALNTQNWELYCGATESTMTSFETNYRGDGNIVNGITAHRLYFERFGNCPKDPNVISKLSNISSIIALSPPSLKRKIATAISLKSHSPSLLRSIALVMCFFKSS